MDIFRGLRGHFRGHFFEDIRQAYFLNNGIHSCVISNDIINNLKYIYFLSLIEINFNIYKIFAYLDLENFGE